eukprot:m.159582 g.159582  ORF g.159582 m.159582 type:complete len:1661 (+) comp38767_c0_seq23:540-5522(+)
MTEENTAINKSITFSALMIGESSSKCTSNFVWSPLNVEMESLSALDDTEASKKTVEFFKQAVEVNLTEKIGLIESIKTFLVDCLKRKHRFKSVIGVLASVLLQLEDMPQQQLIVNQLKIVEDVSEKDLMIALIETALPGHRSYLFSLFAAVGYPVPLFYTVRLTESSALPRNRFDSLEKLLAVPNNPLVLSFGTENTVSKGKTNLLKHLILGISTHSSINSNLFDENGRSIMHSPSIDIAFDAKKERDRFTLADVHGCENDLNFTTINALAIVAQVLLVHVSIVDLQIISKDLTIANYPHWLERIVSFKDCSDKVIMFLVRDQDNEKENEIIENAKKVLNGLRFTNLPTFVCVTDLASRATSKARREKCINQVCNELKKVIASRRKNDQGCFPSLPVLQNVFKRLQGYQLNALPPIDEREHLENPFLLVLRSSSIEKFINNAFPLSVNQAKIAQTYLSEKRIIMEMTGLLDQTEEDKLRGLTKERERLITRERHLMTGSVEGPMKTFLETIEKRSLNCFLEIQRRLEEWEPKRKENRRCKLANLREKLEKARRKNDVKAITCCEKDISEFNLKFKGLDISIDSFWYEIMLMYKHRQQEWCPLRRILSSPMSAVKAYLGCVKKGYPMQLLRGSPLQMAGDFMEDVVKEIDHHFQLQEVKSLLVVSVIGAQNSGKSTLVNALFGCEFATQFGQCTNGLYASYKTTSTQQGLLVLDTEGLLSLRENSRTFDHQMALMAMACSDVVIINHKGEISSQLQEILEICIYVMNELDLAKIKPTVVFALRDVRKTEIENDRVKQEEMEKLMSALENAAKLCNKKVGDVFCIGKNSTFLLPSAFSDTVVGSRQLEVPSADFSEKVLELRQTIVKLAGQGDGIVKINSESETKTPFSDWLRHARIVWSSLENVRRSLLHYKTLYEMKVREDLKSIADEIILKGLKGDEGNATRGFKTESNTLFGAYLRKLNDAVDTTTLPQITKAFQANLEKAKRETHEKIMKEFDQMAKERKFDDFKINVKEGLINPLQFECDLMMYSWRVQLAVKRNQLLLATLENVMANKTDEIFQNCKVQEILSEEDVEKHFNDIWEEAEKEFYKDLRDFVKCPEQLQATVYQAFQNAFLQMERSNQVIFNKEKLVVRSEVEFLQNFERKFWDSYVCVELSPKSHKKRGASPDIDKEDLCCEMKKIVTKTICQFSSKVQERVFDNNLVISFLNEAVSDANKINIILEPFHFRLVTHCFLNDYISELSYKARKALQKKEERKEKELSESVKQNKESQKKIFCYRLSEKADDKSLAEILAAEFRSRLREEHMVKVAEIRMELRGTIIKALGPDQRESAQAAFQFSFETLNYRNVVMYCMDPSHFLFKLYVEHFQLVGEIMGRREKSLISGVADNYRHLLDAAKRWSDQFSSSMESSLEEFEIFLVNTLPSENSCAKIASSSISRYKGRQGKFKKISDIRAFCQAYGENLRRCQKISEDEIKLCHTQEAYSSERTAIWEDFLKGCPECCPHCGTKCEGSKDHKGGHSIGKKRHVFPSFHRWTTLTKPEMTRKPQLTMCLDPVRKMDKIEVGGKMYPSFVQYLKEEHQGWLPFDFDPSYSEASTEIRKSWVNCRKALIALCYLGPGEIIDTTDKTWIEMYSQKEKEITENDLQSLRDELYRDVGDFKLPN